MESLGDKAFLRIWTGDGRNISNRLKQSNNAWYKTSRGMGFFSIGMDVNNTVQGCHKLKCNNYIMSSYISFNNNNNLLHGAKSFLRS
jgi:hypothetical protein